MGQKTSAKCQESKTSCGDVFNMSKRQFFCKSKQCLIKALIRHCKKTSQKCLQDNAKTIYEAIFLISKRQLFCKSNQCLSKPLFRELTHNCNLSRTHLRVSINQFLWNSGFSGLILTNFYHFLGFFVQFFLSFFRVQISVNAKERFFASQFSGVCWLILFYLQKSTFQVLHESQRKEYFKISRVRGKISYEIYSFQGPLGLSPGFQCPLDKLISQSQ